MNRFITRILTYVVLMFSIGFAFIYFAIWICPNKFSGEPYTYFLWDYQTKRMNQQFPAHNNIIIGDSKALAALNPHITGHNFYNFSLSGTTPFEGYSLLKKFIAKNKVDTLLLSYSPLMFNGNPFDFEPATLAFNFIGKEDIENLEKVEQQYHITLDNNKPSDLLYLKRKLITAHFPWYFRADFVNKIFTDIKTPFKKVELFFNENGHSFYGQADSSTALAFEATRPKSLNHFDVNPVSISYFDSIYALCNEKHIKFYYATIPINQTTYQKIDTTPLYTQYISLIESFKTKYPNITILNKYATLPNAYYGDVNHLNQKGCLLFSSYIHEALK